jgi:hypothetical protein
MTMAAALSYLYDKPGAAGARADHEGGDEDLEDDDERQPEALDEEEEEARAREEAGADWMVEQGFDRKD